MRCSIRELARRIGVSDTAINKARADGRVPANLFGVAESGRPYVIDADKAMPIVSDALCLNWKSQSDARLSTKPAPKQPKPKAEQKPAKPKQVKAEAKPTSKPAKQVKVRTEPKPRAPRVKVLAPDPAVPATPEFDDPIDHRTGLPHINISRQKTAHFEAIAAQAKAEAAAGTHIARAEVSKAAFDVGRQVRDALRLLEDRLPDQLASLTDPRRIREMLREEHRRVLMKLSQEVRDDILAGA